ncbi:MAG: toxin-antitoxin system TumE family protein [Candidatus Methanospirareceae archaeon]
MISETYKELSEVAIREFGDIVVETETLKLPSGVPLKLRLRLVDNTFVDVWISPTGKYSYHWEQGEVRGLIFRHNNAPHKRWEYIKTFPKHFHNGSEDNVVESHICDDYDEALREFLSFIRGKVRENL